MSVKQLGVALGCLFGFSLSEGMLAQTAPGTPFKSGFENNTTMGSMSGTPPSGGTQNITGTDASTGSTWSPSIWGSSSKIYLHLIPPTSGSDPFSAHFNNNLVTMTGHTGSSTQVLHMSMNGYPTGTCCEQDVLEANSFTQGIKSEYFRVWVRLPSTLATNFSSDHNSFQMLWEWKTNNHLRTATNIINSGGSIGGWEMQIDTRGRNCDGGGTTGGYIDPNTGATVFNCSQVWSDGFNTGVAVPLNQWFLYEIYNKRSVGNDGTTKMAVNGQLIHEQTGPNYGLNLEEIANAYLMNMYGQASEEWWLDDIEIRDSLPTGCSAFPCGASETGSSTASAAVPFMTSPRGAIGQVGQPFSYQATASPAATSYSAFNLPSGTSINTSTGLISGTPTAAGRYAAVSIHVKNSFGETVHALVFQINSAPSSAPTLSSFTGSPSTINAGQWTQLQWAQSGAATLTMNPGSVDVTGQDPFPVSPSSTTTYTLTAANSVGSVSKTVTVTVSGTGSLPTISSFTATPGSISSGSSTLSWTTSGATSLSVNQGVGTVTGLTSTAVSPTATMMYTLTASNGAGSISASVTVTVNGSVSLPTISSFTATPSSIFPGASSTLTWTTSGATALSIDEGVGTVTGSTSESVSPTGSSTYTLQATNAAGSVTRSVPVAVTAPTISSFAANPSTMSSAGSSTLSWIVSGATGLSINQGVGRVSGTSVSVSPSTTTTYTLTAINAAGSSIAQATITLGVAPKPGIGASIIVE